jgi:hypothetical protein
MENTTGAVNTTSTTEQEQRPILVKSVALLKKLIELGYIGSLCGAKKDKYHEGRRIYYFDYSNEVRGIVDDYINQSKNKSMTEK